MSDSNLPGSLLKTLRKLTRDRPRFSPRPDNAEIPQNGDIRLVQSLSSPRQRLALVLNVREEHNYAEVCLLTNDVDMLTDYDVLLPRKQTGLPFDLVGEFDLTAPIYLIQAGSLFGQFSRGPELEALKAASIGDYSGLDPTLRGMPVRGPSDPRWTYKEEELEVLQEIAAECMQDLLEGNTKQVPVVDPRLIREVLDLPSCEKGRQHTDLIDIAAAAQGGAMPEVALDMLCDALEPELRNPDLQMALQPLFETALFSSGSPKGSRSELSFSPPGVGAPEGLEIELRKTIARLAAGGSGHLVKLLSSRSAWGSSPPKMVPFDIPSRNPVYAEPVDPRRAV